MKKVAILQSNYIPWKGYFDMINMVDEFILYDTVQFTKNDWRNRNLIKTKTGSQWLTIPVMHSMSQNINEIEVLHKNWRRKHWETLKQNYSKSKCFNNFKTIFESLYLNSNDILLSEINFKFIKLINSILGIKTKISWSSDFEISGTKTQKLVNICKQADASEYISGPAAKNYLDENLFNAENIQVTWMDYSNYPEYSQLHAPFEHSVSILDLIFNEGENAVKFMKTFQNQ